MPGVGRESAGLPKEWEAGEMPTEASRPARPRRPFNGFERERATYERHEADLVARAPGEFVAIVGDEVVGPLPTDREAERAGYARFGLGPLYIKQVVAEAPVVTVTRFLAP